MSDLNDVDNDLLDHEFPEFLCEKCGTTSSIVMRVKQIVVENDNGYIAKRVGICIPCYFEEEPPNEE